MIYPPAKFDVDYSKETQVIIKKLMFDPARPPTDILKLITRFHLVKTWLKIHVRRYHSARETKVEVDFPE